MQEFPGNSHMSKIVTPKPEETEAAEPKKVESVIEGTVTRRKKSLGKRFKDVFFAESTGFADYLVKEVLIPGAKDLFFGAIEQTLNGVKQGIEQQVFGTGGRPKKTVGSTNPNRVNYNHISTSRTSIVRSQRTNGYTPSVRATARRSNQVDEIILDTRRDCENVLAELDRMITRQGHCTVGDLYSLVNVRPVSTDEQWGWIDVSDASVNQIAAGEFLLTMPMPEPIQGDVE